MLKKIDDRTWEVWTNDGRRLCGTHRGYNAEQLAAQHQDALKQVWQEKAEKVAAQQRLEEESDDSGNQ